jgi:hypothetical protein
MTSQGLKRGIGGTPLGFAALALALATVLLAGCGGSDENGNAATDTETTETTISKEEFIEQADAICTRSGDAQAEAQSALDTATGAEDAGSAYEGLAEVFQGVNDEIDSLPRPEGDEALIDDLSSKQNEAAALVRELAAAVRAQDQAEAERVATEFEQLTAEIGEIADSYGFEVC